MTPEKQMKLAAKAEIREVDLPLLSAPQVRSRYAEQFRQVFSTGNGACQERDFESYGTHTPNGHGE